MKKTICLFTIAVALSLSVPTHLNGSMLSNAQKKAEQAKQKIRQAAEDMRAKAKARVEATAKDTLTTPDELEQALSRAIADKDKKKLAALLKNPLVAQVLKDKERENQLQLAIVFKDTDIVKMLIDKIKTFPDPKPYLDILRNGESALSLAFVFKQLNTVEWLLDAGASAVIEGQDTSWLLMQTVFMKPGKVPNGFYEKIIAAYKKLPDPQTALNSVNDGGFNAYHHALALNRTKMIALLREAGGDALKNLDLFADTLAHAIIEKKLTTIRNFLESRHADEFLKTSFRLKYKNVDLDAPPLARSVVAAYWIGNDITKMLLKKIKTLQNPGQYLNAKSPEGLTPLHYAVRHISDESVAALLEAGADRNVICVVNGDGDGKSMTVLQYAKLAYEKWDDEDNDNPRFYLSKIIAMLEKK